MNQFDYSPQRPFFQNGRHNANECIKYDIFRHLCLIMNTVLLQCYQTKPNQTNKMIRKSMIVLLNSLEQFMSDQMNTLIVL